MGPGPDRAGAWGPEREQSQAGGRWPFCLLNQEVSCHLAAVQMWPPVHFTRNGPFISSTLLWPCRRSHQVYFIYFCWIYPPVASWLPCAPVAASTLCSAPPGAQAPSGGRTVSGTTAWGRLLLSSAGRVWRAGARPPPHPPRPLQPGRWPLPGAPFGVLPAQLPHIVFSTPPTPLGHRLPSTPEDPISAQTPAPTLSLGSLATTTAP